MCIIFPLWYLVSSTKRKKNFQIVISAFFYLEQGNRDWEEEVVLCHL